MRDMRRGRWTISQNRFPSRHCCGKSARCFLCLRVSVRRELCWFLPARSLWCMAHFRCSRCAFCRNSRLWSGLRCWRYYKTGFSIFCNCIKMGWILLFMLKSDQSPHVLPDKTAYFQAFRYYPISEMFLKRRLKHW